MPTIGSVMRAACAAIKFVFFQPKLEKDNTAA
jgi:hypothetical protein